MLLILFYFLNFCIFVVFKYLLEGIKGLMLGMIKYEIRLLDVLIDC